ncbi:MAG: type IV pilus modification protein PilV [Spongiibacter sp.]|uniref:Type IV pilus modification protein PilV n=1 Tax=Spongiibacter thalassae TaxID=2721624 RepID=A0ABX1GK40_9GAMM|nr:type IV pilus modification protein PilV [Spongiibacter thalassae]NKI18817.1 type IV pilus modification protein PilV [Spongiibacter thalassae]
MKRSQLGVSLIEVMVAVLVTTTGVLGAAALQLNAVKFNQAAHVRSMAVFLANDMADRIRANRGAALAGLYDLPMDANAPSGDDIPAADRREWLTELARRLPSGDGSVVRVNTRFTITIQWDEGRLRETREQNADDNQTFVFVTEL